MVVIISAVQNNLASNEFLILFLQWVSVTYFYLFLCLLVFSIQRDEYECRLYSNLRCTLEVPALNEHLGSCMCGLFIIIFTKNRLCFSNGLSSSEQQAGSTG